MEEEFKTLLKDLFVEKKRAGNLQKKFCSKLLDERQEISQLKAQLARVKPVLSKLLNEKESLKEKCYSQLQELKQRCSLLLNEKEKLTDEVQLLKEALASKEVEIKQAQYHFAKKVKETTILRDLVEKQKMQIAKQL